MNREYARELDQRDPLSRYKEEFYLPEHLYYEANGLGPMSRRSEKTLKRVAEEWKTQLVSGWFCGKIPWFHYPERLAAMEQNLAGAFEKELVVAGGTTTNIHSLVSAFYRPEGIRTKIICDHQIFCSDRYALEAQIRLKGYDPEKELVLAGGGGPLINEELIIEAMGEDTALVFLPSVVHSTGQLLDIERLAKEAVSREIVIGLDLSHSIGVMPHKLHDWGVDFATWCNYKYLSGGLGCPATIFIHEKNFHISPAMPGWHGYVKERQFQKLPYFEAETGAGGWQHGSPLILNMAPLEGALDMVLEAGIDAIREKSLAMTGYFMSLMEEELSGCGVQILTPRESERRGGHVTILHVAADEITEFLDSDSVLTDGLREAVRRKMERRAEPSVEDQVRIAFSPLFMSYEDVWQTADNLCRLLRP